MKIISISLQKGGSAKTTTAVNLAANLAARKRRVLLIDMDSQANATFSSGVNSRDLENSLYNVLTPDSRYKCSIRDAIIRTDFFDLIPADRDVADLSDELKSATALRNVLQTVSNLYDFVILDTPPALNIISQNALAAADYVIIPAEPRPFNFTGMVDLRDSIEAVRASHNPKLMVLGILLVKHNQRTNLTKTVQDLITDYAAQLGTSVYAATIREAVAVPESQLAQKPLIYYAKSAKPTIDYKAFTTETLKRMGEI